MNGVFLTSKVNVNSSITSTLEDTDIRRIRRVHFISGEN